MKYIVPVLDSIEFLVLALQLSERGNDVLFVIVREEKNPKRDDRFVKASVIIQDVFNADCGTASFFYTNIEKELASLNEKTKVNIESGLIVDAILQSMAKESDRRVLVPYSITDYYLCTYMLRGESRLRDSTKSDIYALAGHNLPLDLLNQYRALDLQRIEDLGITHKQIEMAHEWLKQDGWPVSLNNNFTEQERECLQWAMRNKYES
jgi:hypothetical protein